MPTNDPQPGERWIVRLIPGGTREAEVLLRATPHDMVSMPGMVVVFRYLGRQDTRAWTMTLRNFCGMFDWRPHYEVEPPVGAEIAAPGGGDPYRYSRLLERWQRGHPESDGGQGVEVLEEQTAAALWAAQRPQPFAPVVAVEPWRFDVKTNRWYRHTPTATIFLDRGDGPPEGDPVKVERDPERPEDPADDGWPV